MPNQLHHPGVPTLFYPSCSPQGQRPHVTSRSPATTPAHHPSLCTHTSFWARPWKTTLLPVEAFAMLTPKPLAARPLLPCTVGSCPDTPFFRALPFPFVVPTEESVGLATLFWVTYGPSPSASLTPVRAWPMRPHSQAPVGNPAAQTRGWPRTAWHWLLPACVGVQRQALPLPLWALGAGTLCGVGLGLYLPLWPNLLCHSQSP